MTITSRLVVGWALYVLTASAWANDPVVGNSTDATDATATSSTASGPSTAAETQSGALQEVLVTATRREEALEKVPVSVQAITNVQMEVAGVREFTDVVRQTPEIQLNPSYGGGNDVAIRGIASMQEPRPLASTSTMPRSRSSTTTLRTESCFRQCLICSASRCCADLRARSSALALKAARCASFRSSRA